MPRVLRSCRRAARPRLPQRKSRSQRRGGRRRPIAGFASGPAWMTSGFPAQVVLEVELHAEARRENRASPPSGRHYVDSLQMADLAALQQVTSHLGAGAITGRLVIVLLLVLA